MAQKIVTLCDVHARHDEEHPGALWEVTLRAPGESRAVTWEVDLCDDDGKPLRDLALMLDEVGRVTDGPRRRMATAARKAARTNGQARTAPGVHRSGRVYPSPVEAPHTAEGYPCPLGCGKMARSRKALMSHLRAYHDGMSLAEATGQPLPYPCPDCPRKFSHATGLGAHRKAAHGYVSPSGAGALPVAESGAATGPADPG